MTDNSLKPENTAGQPEDGIQPENTMEQSGNVIEQPGNASGQPEDVAEESQDPEGPVFLMNVSDDLSAGMLETLLVEAGIPVLRKYPETGQYLHIVMGSSLYGTDLYVPADHLEAARRLVADFETPEPAGTAAGMVEIRPMDLTDYPSVREMWDSIPGIGLRSLDDSPEGISRFLFRNPTSCFVGDADGAIVGSVLCGHDGRRGYLYHVAVLPEFRGRGIGRALVDSALQALAAEGIHKSAVIVFKDNGLGNPFWEALGWERRDDLNYFNKSLSAENL